MSVIDVRPPRYGEAVTDYDHGRICSACGDVVIFCSCVAKVAEREAGGDSSESPAGD